MTLGAHARKVAAEIYHNHHGDRASLVKKFRDGYHDFCIQNQYGVTSSGYKAWRREVRRLLGLQPQPYSVRKSSQSHKDKLTKDLFSNDNGYKVGTPHD